MSPKSVTQSKAKYLIERHDKLEVMMEALMRKIDKLSTEMISRYYAPIHKEMRLKDLLEEHLLLQMKVKLETLMMRRSIIWLIMEESLVHTKISYMRHDR